MTIPAGSYLEFKALIASESLHLQVAWVYPLMAGMNSMPPSWMATP